MIKWLNKMIKFHFDGFKLLMAYGYGVVSLIA